MAGTLVQLGSVRATPFNGGTSVAGAQLFVYDAGTTTKRALYTTSALSVSLSNPVVADANGRFVAPWLNPAGGAYKVVLASASDTDPPASPFWTEDNIPTEIEGDIDLLAILLGGSAPNALIVLFQPGDTGEAGFCNPVFGLSLSEAVGASFRRRFVGRRRGRLGQCYCSASQRDQDWNEDCEFGRGHRYRSM